MLFMDVLSWMAVYSGFPGRLAIAVGGRSRRICSSRSRGGIRTWSGPGTGPLVITVFLTVASATAKPDLAASGGVPPSPVVAVAVGAVCPQP
jgi:hypothetical protein